MYSIPLEEGLEVIITPTQGGFSIKSSIAECPKGKEPEFLTQAMTANVFGQGTDHCVLGLDESGKYITLNREIDYRNNYSDFSHIIEDFIYMIDFWRDEAAE